MAAIDIRATGDEPIDCIVFADQDATSSGIYKIEIYDSSEVRFENSNDESSYLRKTDIDNFITALQKAKELWT
jgi:hypothetical protein